MKRYLVSMRIGVISTRHSLSSLRPPAVLAAIGRLWLRAEKKQVEGNKNPRRVWMDIGLRTYADISDIDEDRFKKRRRMKGRYIRELLRGLDTSDLKWTLPM